MAKSFPQQNVELPDCQENWEWMSSWLARYDTFLTQWAPVVFVAADSNNGAGIWSAQNVTVPDDCSSVIAIAGSTGWSTATGGSTNLFKWDGTNEKTWTFTFNITSNHCYMGTIVLVKGSVTAGTHTLNFTNSSGVALNVDSGDNWFYFVIGMK